MEREKNTSQKNVIKERKKRKKRKKIIQEKRKKRKGSIHTHTHTHIVNDDGFFGPHPLSILV